MIESGCSIGDSELTKNHAIILYSFISKGATCVHACVYVCVYV